jgi:formate hydrogenlyase subunit 3/multisubunit Na+/H+ antiporter MnhD subunit
MVDTGMLTLALVRADALGVELERAMVLTRVWGVLTAAAGLAAVGAGGPSSRGWRSALGAVALVAGLLTLAGFPPTVGFASRWGLYRLIFQDQPLTALALLLASFGPVVGMLRMLPEALRVEFAADRTLALTDLLLALMAAGAIGLGLFPQILIYR